MNNENLNPADIHPEDAPRPVFEPTPAPLTGGHPLHTRVKPKPTEQINGKIVGGAFTVTAGILSLAFIYAFVIAPKVQAQARAKQAEENQRTPQGSVKPADVLAHGPKSYADLTKAPEETAPADDSTLPDKALPTPQIGTGAPHPTRVIVERAPRLEPVESYSPPAPPAPRGPSELELARRSPLFFEESGPNDVRAASSPDTAPPSGLARLQQKEDYAEVYGTHAILAPLSPYEVKAGTIVPAALLTAVDTERAGQVMAVVTENVFDTVTGTHLLIPQGTKLLGRFDGDQAYGARRAYLVWERILFADGRSLTLDKEPGVDVAGAGGVRGHVDRRLGQLAIASLFAGAITTLGEAARRDGADKSSSLLGDAGDAAANEAARVGGRLIGRELDVKPVIRIAQGSRVQVLLTHDLILEPVS